MQSSKRQRIELSITRPPEHLCCPLTGSLLKDPVCAPNGVTYSRAAVEKAQIFPASQLHRNALVSQLLAQWQQFAQEHQHQYDCPYCHEVVIDPISLPCCGRNFCKLCMQRENSEEPEDSEISFRCPVCRHYTDLQLNSMGINKDLSAMLELHMGVAAIERERQERQQAHVQSQQLRTRVEPYLKSMRWCILKRLIGECIGSDPMQPVDQILAKLRASFAEIQPQQTLPLEQELDLALATLDEPWVYRFGNHVLVREVSRLTAMLLKRDGLVKQEELNGWPVEVVHRAMQDNAVGSRVASNFLRMNFPDQSWDYIDLEDLHNRKKSIVLGFVDQLKEEDLEGCTDEDCDASEEE